MKEVPKILYHGTNLPYYISQVIKHEPNYRHDGTEKVQMTGDFGLSLGHAIRTSVQNRNRLPLVLVIDTEKLHREPCYRPGDDDGLDPAWTIDHLTRESHRIFPITFIFDLDKDRLRDIENDGLVVKVEEMIANEIEKSTGKRNA